MPVISATREAEAGKSLEPRRQTLERAEIVPLHSSLGNKSETVSENKKRNKQQTILPILNLTLGKENKIEKFPSGHLLS